MINASMVNNLPAIRRKAQANQPAKAHCHECGESFFITDTGIAHHTGNPIDHDADADHVPFTLEG